MIYSDYSEYAGIASEVCSYNNITNSYNQFFIDAIHERYAAADEKIWLKAAYTITALQDIIFGIGYESIETFNEEVFRLAIEISPETGNLQSTHNALKLLNTLVRNLSSITPRYSDAIEPLSVPAPGWGSPEEYMAQLHADTTDPDSYENYFVIDQPISGDFFVMTESAADPRPPAPEVVINKSNYLPLGTTVRDCRTSYDDVSARAIAIVEIFYPRVNGALPTAENSTRYMTLQNAATGMLFDGLKFRNTGLGPATWEVSFGADYYSDPPEAYKTDIGTLKLNRGQYIVNQMCRRSTMDVEISAGGAQAQLRYSDDRMFRLRDGRSLNGLLKLLNDYHEEATLMVAGSSDTAYSSIAMAAYNPDGYFASDTDDGVGHYWYPDHPGGMPDIAMLSAPTFESLDFPQAILSIITELRRSVGLIIAYWGHDAETMAVIDEYNLIPMMNASDPVGPGSFVDITD